MIKVLGTQRIIVLLVLLGINAVLALAVYTHFIPQKTVKERELRSVRSQSSTLRNDIADLQIEFEQLDEQREEFARLKRNGFFDGQSRRKAELIFQKIQERSGVISAVASVSAGTLEENEQAKKADHQILKSPINIRIEALNDLDVFRYLYLVNEFFPGHVTTKRIDFERSADINGTVLRAIANGQTPPLVSANLQLIWRTMVPIEKEQSESQGGAY